MATDQQEQPDGSTPVVQDETQPIASNEKQGQNATQASNGESQAPTATPVKQETDAQKQSSGDSDAKSSSKGPEGGFDSTPIPKPAPGTTFYTLKITMHRAANLAMGDIETFSSDPYVLAQLNTDTPTRHKEDPYLRFRTFTVRKTTEPEWNENWVVANVPSSGFKLKLRVYDEDPADHDDLLGKVHITVPSLSDSWPGIKEQPYKLAVAQSSKRALIVRSLAACMRIVPRHMQGELYVSIENLGRTGEDGQNGRSYTIGDCRWFRHHSPMLGRITHTKDFSTAINHNNTNSNSRPSGDQKKQIEHYNFQANQIQLQGPVPADLYHRFVEFKPWVKRMFTTSGLQGVVLGKALHHQHTRVYNFGRSTVWGHFPQGPSEAMTRQFLELAHYGQGGRIFTYVLTLDALWRFTETGKEFGIDMLSKHTMHSDVSIYIAFSGEFFVRRRLHHHHTTTAATAETPPGERSTELQHATHEGASSPTPVDDQAEPSTDPSHYELVIDNDSGTYRPNAAKLPILASFLSHALPGLHVQTLDCVADADKMAALKDEQRERKKQAGRDVVYTQGDRSSSISSSDEEDLDRPRDVEPGTTATLANDFKRQQAARWDRVKHGHGGKSRREDGEAEGGDADVVGSVAAGAGASAGDGGNVPVENGEREAVSGA